MDAQLCAVCEGMFAGEQVLRESRPHHQSKTAILAAAEGGCRFCSIITRSRGFEHFESGEEEFKASWYLYRYEDLSTDGSEWFRLTLDAMGDDVDEDEDEDDEDEDEDDEGEEDEDEENAPDAQGGTSQDVDEHGNVCIPASGADANAHDPHMIPPCWAFALVPTNALPASDMSYEPPADTQDPRMWSLAESWLDNCVRNHPKCRPRDHAFRPTRLVEIMDEKTVRVIERGNKAMAGEYASFSHCWGQAKTLKLLQGNKTQLEAGVQIADLPQSYVEAIGVATRLGIRLLWIDSLCIIQDSVDDWRAEASTMKDVYGNAMVNISASAAAENSEASFLRREPLNIPPLRIAPRWRQGSGEGRYLLANVDGYRDEIERSPLGGRAWVMQESYLSGRNLSLTTTQLWWECRESLMSEAWPGGVPEKLRYDPYNKAGDPSEISSYHVVWCDLVEKYAACGLTVFSDKLVAMAGLASHRWGLLGGEEADEYIAGLWRSQLPHSLCWETDNFHKTYRTAQYRAPSWSWASIEGSIQFVHKTHGAGGPSTVALCDVVDVRLVLAGTDRTGALKGGYMRLRGRLISVGVSGSALTVEGTDGTHDFLEGTDGNREEGHDGQTNRTIVVLDENTSDGEPVVSYIDTAAVDVLQPDASLEEAVRTSRVSHDAQGDEAFCLPVMEWVERGESRMRGLLLAHPKGEPPGRYQRVGLWSAYGAITVPQLKKGEVQEFVIV
ncbi:uncharacterized protein DNG_09603 [Cephalotrichum gorgonifer]|uniref:Heterokaryon incompatibility domain-containing protein n=1 Tax=Cephalotrichum gorgonifer TaxID=2041049 RepID=A0AAE8N761_9PEZI|nr:uncharacterized protein DNG_09603 [Cephalotrichum gorgonifer]